MIFFSVFLCLLIVAAFMWNNIYRRYAIGVYSWMMNTVLPTLKANEEWTDEAEGLQFDVAVDIDEYVNESFGFILPLTIVLAINGSMLAFAFGGQLPAWLNLPVAIGNAACVVGCLVQRKRYYWIRGQVLAYQALLNAEQIHTESLKNEEQ